MDPNGSKKFQVFLIGAWMHWIPLELFWLLQPVSKFSDKREPVFDFQFSFFKKKKKLVDRSFAEEVSRNPEHSWNAHPGKQISVCFGIQSV